MEGFVRMLHSLVFPLLFSLFQTRSTGVDGMLAEPFGFDRGLVKVSDEGVTFASGRA